MSGLHVKETVFSWIFHPTAAGPHLRRQSTSNYSGGQNIAWTGLVPPFLFFPFRLCLLQLDS